MAKKSFQTIFCCFVVVVVVIVALWRPHSDCFMLLKKIGSKRINQKLTKFPERSATLRNFAGFQIFVIKPVFVFLSFIGPFTMKVAILCSELTPSGPVQVVAL